MNPWHFWRSVQPHHELHVRRIVRYWLAVGFCATASMFALYAHSCLTLHRFNVAQRPITLSGYRIAPRSYDAAVRLHGSIEAALDAWHPVAPQPRLFRYAYRHNGPVRAGALLVVMLMLWPWLVSVVMQVFRTTLRTARIRPGHLVRCATYSCDVAVWLVALPALAYAAWLWFQPMPVPAASWSPYTASAAVVLGFMLVVAILISLTTLRLCVAYRRYLRLRHAVTTALLVQVVVVLTYATFLLPAMDL